MPKRQPLDYNSTALSNTLKASTGQGVSAFFSTPPPVDPSKKTASSQNRESVKSPRRKRATLLNRKTADLPERESASSQSSTSAKAQKRKIAKARKHKVAEPQLQNRKRISHGLGIYEDQLFSLKEIQLKRQKGTGQRYNLGDLAAEALDLFIKQELGET